MLVAGSSADSQAVNRYLYCGANPIGRVDPSGCDLDEDLGDIKSQANELREKAVELLLEAVILRAIAHWMSTVNPYPPSKIFPGHLNGNINLIENEAAHDRELAAQLLAIEENIDEDLKMATDDRLAEGLEEIYAHMPPDLHHNTEGE